MEMILLFLVVVLILGILYGVKMKIRESELSKDASSDYTNISWEELNYFCTDITGSNLYYASDDLTLFVDFSHLTNMPRYQQKIGEFIKSNPDMTFNNYDMHVKFTQYGEYSFDKDDKRNGLIIHLKSGHEFSRTDIQKQNNFYGDNITYNDNSRILFKLNSKLNSENTNYLTDDDRELIKCFMKNINQNKVSESDRLSLIKRISAYGEVASSLISIIKSIIL